MLKVLVPLAISKTNNPNYPLHFLRSSYMQKLIKYNIVPIMVSYLMTDKMIDELYNYTCGLLLTGGSDIDPYLYGEKKHERTTIKEPERDMFEINLVRKVIKDKKPLLGICRGAQLLNVALGGTLHQHVPDIISIKETHNIPLYDELKYENVLHDIIIDTNSKLYKIIKKERITVNTDHHQSVSKVETNLKPSAFTKSGIIEAIEHTSDNYFCFGLQSHPEVQENGEFEPIFKSFANAVKKYSKLH